MGEGSKIDGQPQTRSNTNAATDNFKALQIALKQKDAELQKVSAALQQKDAKLQALLQRHVSGPKSEPVVYSTMDRDGAKDQDPVNTDPEKVSQENATTLTNQTDRTTTKNIKTYEG